MLSLVNKLCYYITYVCINFICLANVYLVRCTKAINYFLLIVTYDCWFTQSNVLNVSVLIFQHFTVINSGGGQNALS